MKTCKKLNYAQIRKEWVSTETKANTLWDAGKYRESIDARKKSYLLFNAMVSCPSINSLKS